MCYPIGNILILTKEESKVTKMRHKHAIAKRISQLRAKHKYTQRTLGALVGVSHNTIKKWCDGDLVPKRQNIRKLGKIFNVSPAYLMFGIGDKAADPLADPITKVAVDIFQCLTRSNQEQIIQLMTALLESPKGCDVFDKENGEGNG